MKQPRLPAYERPIPDRPWLACAVLALTLAAPAALAERSFDTHGLATGNVFGVELGFSHNSTDTTITAAYSTP